MEMVRQVLAVAVVFAALAGALWALRRNRGGWGGLRRKQAGRLEPLERVALSPHHALHLVRFGDRMLLISTTTGGCTLLDSAAFRDAAPQSSGAATKGTGLWKPEARSRKPEWKPYRRSSALIGGLHFIYRPQMNADERGYSRAAR
jgi:hypothetical protein